MANVTTVEVVRGGQSAYIWKTTNLLIEQMWDVRNRIVKDDFKIWGLGRTQLPLRWGRYS